MSEQPSSVAVVLAAAIRGGYKVAYEIDVNGKAILSRGEVFGIRRVAHNKIEITLMHVKTGALFTNVIKANSPVQLLDVTLDPTAGPLAAFLAEQLINKLKEQVSDFYTVMPIED